MSGPIQHTLQIEGDIVIVPHRLMVGLYRDVMQALVTTSMSGKIVAAICDGKVHVAVGYSGHEHVAIADQAFRASIGQDWRSRAASFGGGKLSYDSGSGAFHITGSSGSLANYSGSYAVPQQAIAPILAALQARSWA